MQTLQGTAQADMMSLAFSASLSHASEAKPLHSRALWFHMGLHRGVTRLPPLPSQTSSAGEICLCTGSGYLDAKLLMLPCLMLLFGDLF